MMPCTLRPAPLRRCSPFSQNEEALAPRLDLQALLQAPPRHKDIAAHDGGKTLGGVGGCSCRPLSLQTGGVFPRYPPAARDTTGRQLI